MKKAIVFAVLVSFVFAGCAKPDNAWDPEWDEPVYETVNDGGVNLFPLQAGDNFINYYDGFVYVWRYDRDVYTSAFRASDAASPYTPASPPPSSVYRMRPDGSDREKIEGDSAVFSNRDWYRDGWLYYTGPINDTWLSPSALFKMRLDGTERQEIVRDSVARPLIRGDWIYYRSTKLFTYDKLFRVKTDGSGKESIAKDCQKFIVDDGYVFLVDGPGNTNLEGLMRYNLNGTGKKRLLPKDRSASYTPLFVHDGWLYYNSLIWIIQSDTPDEDRDTLFRMRINGKSNQKIMANMPENIICRDSYLYCFRAQSMDGKINAEISRINLDGSGETAIAGSFHGVMYQPTQAHYRMIEDGFLYASYAEDGATVLLNRIDFDGNSVVVYDGSGGEYANHFVHEQDLYVVTQTSPAE